jgi:hypothetical protein
MGGLVFAMLMMVGVGGNGTLDLVSLLDPPQYFKSRGIEVKPEKMLELAGKSPAGGKEAVGQLLAIRWLGEHADVVKKTGNARETIQAIANGQRGKDSQGFARDYARVALARVEGKTLTLHHLAAGSVRSEALAWFPRKCTIFGAVDYRPPPGIPEQHGNPVADMMNSMMRPQDKEAFYKVEELGNIRLDRASFAVLADANQPAKTRLFIRVTGKGDRKRLLAFFRQNMNRVTFIERKGPGGEPITVFDTKNHGPAFALIGDTEVLMAGYPAGSAAQPFNQVDVLDDVLAVRAGKKANVTTGPFAGTLKGVSRKATGLLIGDLPEPWRQMMTQGRGNPFRGFPQNFNVILTRKAKGLDVRFTGGAASAKEAKGFVDGVERAKQLALEGLKNLPPFLKIKPKTIDAIRAAVKGARVEAKDALLTGRVFLSNEAARATGYLIVGAFLGFSGSAERVAPAPKP